MNKIFFIILITMLVAGCSGQPTEDTKATEYTPETSTSESSEAERDENTSADATDDNASKDSTDAGNTSGTEAPDNIKDTNNESTVDNASQDSDAESGSTAETTDDSHKVTVYFFWGDGCPHCAEEKPFLEELEQKHPELEVKMFETWNNPDNVDIFRDFAQAHGFEARAVPTTLVGEEHWVGYSQAMGKEIENKINDCIENDCPNPGDNVN